VVAERSLAAEEEGEVVARGTGDLEAEVEVVRQPTGELGHAGPGRSVDVYHTATSGSVWWNCFW
jgi:hypothetical protein